MAGMIYYSIDPSSKYHQSQHLLTLEIFLVSSRSPQFELYAGSILDITTQASHDDNPSSIF